MKYLIRINNIFLTLVLLALSFICSLAVHQGTNAPALIPSIFVLAVFLISLLTGGYFYGIIASLISVLAVNFAFTFPFFEFNFTIHENAVSALIMMIITVVTCALTTKIRKQESIRADIEKEKMRANLLRAVSHDLRTPLTAIFGASSTIIDNYEALDDENKLQMLNGIKDDSQWLIRMVENLLSVTKIDNNNLRLIKTSTVPEELIDSVLAKFKKRYPDQKVELELPEEFITISADALLIEQVLINLLENAVQHAKGMTLLRLRVFMSDSKAVFEVIDNGCGIDKEHLKSIFSGSIGLGSGPSDSHNQSMGIGLSVCSTIIKAHGGNIQAKLLKTGGMKFTFSLEIEEDKDE